jgi:hypothetical protein
VGNRDEARRPVRSNFGRPRRSTLDRNFFLYQGDIFIIVDYHKSRSATNLIRVVARCLPNEVAILVLLHLAYIRPFINFLYNETSEVKNPYDGDYLFCDVSQPTKSWHGKQLTKAMRQATEEHVGTPLGIAVYRHFVVAVTRKHLRKLAGFFGLKVSEGWEKRFRQELGSEFWAWQAAHSNETEWNHYGIEEGYTPPPPGLPPEFLDVFRRISKIWHRVGDMIRRGCR